MAYHLLQAQDKDQNAFDNRGLPEGGPPYSHDDLSLGEYLKNIREAKPNILFGMNATQI